MDAVRRYCHRMEWLTAVSYTHLDVYKRQQGNRPAGIGVQFADTAEGESVRSKIETTLAGTLGGDQPTQTM